MMKRNILRVLIILFLLLAPFIFIGGGETQGCSNNPLVICGPPDRGERVGFELVLAVDGSGSMHRDEMKIQRQGYANALRSDEFLEIVERGTTVAVYYFEWSSFSGIKNELGWHLIKDRESAFAFAEAIETRKYIMPSGGTNMARALEHAHFELYNNNYSSFKKVIDISADGKNGSNQRNIASVRDEVVDGYTVINGLAIMLPLNADDEDMGPSDTDIDEYMEKCVIGGPNSFVEKVSDVSEFDDVIRRKLVNELALDFNFIGKAFAEPGDLREDLDPCVNSTSGSLAPSYTIQDMNPVNEPMK